MAIEDELTHFRNAWKDELSTTCPTKHVKAKQLYLKGVQLEREGYCYEAIEYFRQALKLVPDIEEHVDVYIDIDSNTAGGSSYNIPGLEEVEGQSLSSLTSADEGQWVAKFETSEMYFEDASTCMPERVQNPTHISALPNEIILLILRYVVSIELDLRAIESFAGVCKRFYKLARTSRLWQAACQKIWPDMRVQSAFSTWRGMFINRPHLRFDGIYVSRIKYYREGEQRQSHCCTLQTVFYHRFLRFFSDGLVLGLNTTQVPQTAVPALKDRASPNKDVYYGQYTISGDVIKLTLFQRDTSSRSTPNIKLKPDHSLNITLNLSRKSSRQMLEWADYFITTKRNGDTTKSNIELEPPHFCRFVFVRAKSYAAVSAGTV